MLLPYAWAVELGELQQNWDDLGREDPMWAILSDPAQRGGKWDRDAFFATGREHVDEALEHLRSVGAEPATGRAMDFGCGIGRLTQALAEHFDKVDGVDIAASMIDQANELNQHGERVAYHQNGREDLSLFDDGTFDLVFSLIVLQHIENRYKTRYLKEFVRILAPGGIALFTVPSHPTMTWRGIAYRLIPNGPLNFYRKKRYGNTGVIELHGMRRPEVEAAVRAAGGEVLDVSPEPLLGTPWHSYRYTVRVSDPKGTQPS